MKKNRLLFVFSIGLIALASCNKEDDNPENPSNAYEAVNVLKDNSGYERLWDTVTAYGSLSSITGFVVKDFTVDTRNRMHIVGHYRDEYFRRSLDLTNKKIIPQHPNAAKVDQFSYMYNVGNFNRDVEQFKPYTNYYVAVFQTERSSFGYSKIYLKGDVGVHTETSYAMGLAELGYENVSVPGDGGVHMYIGLNKKDDEDFNYLNSNTTIEIAKPFSEQLYYVLCDARTLGKSLYIGFNKTQLKAIEYDRDKDKPVTTGTVTATLDWKPYVEWKMTTVEYPEKRFVTAFRHYSVDGKKLSFALMNIDTYKFTTFTYDFVTKEFKKVLDDVELSYGRRGSSEYLFDLDEGGNIYYAGYAGNGSNENGVSVYKISGNGTTTLVGVDNFLKFGTVAKLKYLYGKLYLAVKVTKTANVHQLSFIRQK